MDKNLQKLKDSINTRGWSANARINFNKSISRNYSVSTTPLFGCDKNYTVCSDA